MALRSAVFQSGGPTLWSAVGGRGPCVSLPASGWLLIPGGAARAPRFCGSLLKAPFPNHFFFFLSEQLLCVLAQEGF